MARANRHTIPGQVWHLTHRCHNQQWLLRFAKDRRRWLYWLYEARRRYGLIVLNYVVTSNHVHLLVKDRGDGEISQSIQLIAGRTAQEYNKRKSRCGAFWEDRYHSTAVQSDDHLHRCITYIDLNMVRAGAVRHPEYWMHGGYAELQAPAYRYKRVDYESLLQLLDISSVEQMRQIRARWIAAELRRGQPVRKPEWTESVAVGSETYINSILQQLKIRNPSRRLEKADEFCVLHDTRSNYIAFSA